MIVVEIEMSDIRRSVFLLKRWYSTIVSLVSWLLLVAWLIASCAPLESRRLPSLVIDQSLVRVVQTTSTESATSPQFRLEVAPAAAFSSDTHLSRDAFRLRDGAPLAQIRFWAERNAQTLLGQSELSANGWTRTILRTNSSTITNTTIYVTGITEDGLQSIGIPIENGWWVESSASSSTNTQFFGRTVSSLGIPTQLTVITSPAANSIDGQAAQHQEVVWKTLAEFDNFAPQTRSDFGMAFDSSRDRLVIFGGKSAGGLLADTWEWDGQSVWVERVSQSGLTPAPRANHVMGYDHKRRQVLMFGGQTHGSILDDTWVWNGQQWRHLASDTHPTARTSAAMAYDDRSAQFVLFGGDLNSTNTWIWNELGWSVVSVTGDSPTARFGHTMAYDPVEDAIYMFGGTLRSSRQPTDEFWQLKEGQWTLLSIQGPEARTGHAMAFDEVCSCIVITGGTAGTRTFADTWTFKNQTWTEVLDTQSTNSIGRRTGHKMVLDNNSRRVLLFGGAPNNMLWSRVSNQWAKVGDESALSPSPRVSYEMTYDTHNSQIVLFGGRSPNGTSRELFNDLWFWNGRKWDVQIGELGIQPSARRFHAMAYHQSNREIMVFAGESADGYLNDLWAWNGVSWNEIPNGSNPPPNRHSTAIVYDSARIRLLMFGGQDTSALGDFWSWTDSGWTQIVPSVGPTPPARFGHAMVYDSFRGRVVLFGGQNTTLLSDMWEWDGNSWTQITSSSQGPSPRRNHAMFYEPNTRSIVVLGGEDNSGTQLNDAWVWNGSNWQAIVLPQTSPFDSPIEDVEFDLSSNQAVLFGTDTDGLPGTWTIEAAAPAIQLSASIPKVIVDQANEFNVRAFCGGQTIVQNQQILGSTLYIFRPGLLGDLWVPVATTQEGTTPKDSTSPMTFSVLDEEDMPSRIMEYWIDQSPQQSSGLYVQCRTTSSETPASVQAFSSVVAADFLDLWIGYELNR